MSEWDWKPLANPGKHKPPWCDACNGDYCGPADGPCRCCLAAEVEVLRAQVAAVREVCEDTAVYCADMPDDDPVPLVFVTTVLRALDGPA